ncbi:MAG: MarR family transcriptional regulator [Candidatus Sphingomonas colombiensis]|nr:MarR family transcriptional regulator [Sphingomonas sp.]WEK44060.1 MAG: MarR family transcriptional regulator [Sphingomonas sp.]
MQTNFHLIKPLFQGFEWFDEGLQRSLKAAGWAPVTRPESMVILHVLGGETRPADIARALRLSRQAVHSTIASLVEAGFFALAPDPADGRVKIVVLTDKGRAMKDDADRIVERLAIALEKRIGKREMAALRGVFATDWGEPVTIEVAHQDRS